MKEEILRLRAEGKSYSEICKILGCKKSTVSYHCGEGQKQKQLDRQQIKRKSEVLETKIERFVGRTISEKCRFFQRRDGAKVGARKDYNFTAEELLMKVEPVCYLTGKEIDLKDGKSYHLDHIIPASKGGENTLDNVGILDATVNKMKHDLTVDEFISKCKEILEYKGYKVYKESGQDGNAPVC